jgi:uncharacterized protein (DUF4415 family)
MGPREGRDESADPWDFVRDGEGNLQRSKPRHQRKLFYRRQGEQRYFAIGLTLGLVLLLVVFVDRSEANVETIHIISAKRQINMSVEHTKTNSVRRLKISDETRLAYANRDKSLDSTDPDCPTMPPEFWDGATIGKYYRPVKTQISFRIDNEILDWLKSKGDGHLTRINEILRERMVSERST